MAEKRRLAQIARAVAAAEAKTVREINAEWEAWLQRRMQAEQRGEPFDEPSPSARQRDAATTQQ